ncbi:MAG: peptidylprolyl isomerase, partial [Paracoccaceae bacterium]|nr:peptidylprolyl isomerase [Paracoccaceae bacterium]
LENQRRSLLAGSAIDAIMTKDIHEDDIQRIYDTNYAQAKSGSEYNASHILVETEEAALALVIALEGGAGFSELAKEKSTGPSRMNGGELGWFGAGMMVPPFEKAVQAMQVGAVSAPIQTQFGWHVIKLNESRAVAAPALTEVRGEIELQLSQQAAEAHIQALVSTAGVTRVAEGDIDPALLLNQALLD